MGKNVEDFEKDLNTLKESLKKSIVSDEVMFNLEMVERQWYNFLKEDIEEYNLDYVDELESDINDLEKDNIFLRNKILELTKTIKSMED